MGRFDNPDFEFSGDTNTQSDSGYASVDPTTITRDPKFLMDLRTHYRDQGVMVGAASDEDLLDMFHRDRNWADFNSLALAKDTYDAYTATGETRARAKRLQGAWQSMPNFYEEGGRGFIEMAKDVLPAVALDPVNFVGGLAAKPAALGAAATRIAAGETAEQAARAGVKAGIKRAAGTEALVSGGVEAGFDAATQARDISLGLQDEYSLGQTGVAAGVGATIGGVAGALVGIPGAFAGSRQGQEAYQVLKNLGVTDEAIANIPVGQVDKLISNPDALGEFATQPENREDRRGLNKTAADIPFGTDLEGEAPAIAAPEPEDDGLEATATRFNTLIEAQRNYIARLRADGADITQIENSEAYLARISVLQSMPDRLAREAGDIKALEASNDPIKRKRGEARRLAFERDLSDFRTLMGDETTGEEENAIIGRLLDRKEEIEEEDAVAKKPKKAKATPKAKGAKAAAKDQAEEQTAEGVTETGTPDAEAAVEEEPVPQTPEEIAEEKAEEADRFPPTKNAGKFSAPAQKYIDDNKIKIKASDIGDGEGSTGFITKGQLEKFLKEKRVAEKPDVAAPTPVPEALRRSAIQNGIDYRKVMEEDPTQKPRTALKNALKKKQEEGGPIDEYVANLSMHVDELMQELGDGGIDDADEALRLLIAAAKDRGEFDPKDVEYFFTDLLNDTRNQGLLDDIIEFDTPLTKAKEANAKARADAMVAADDSVSPEFALKMARIEVASEGRADAKSPRGSSQKWGEAGKFTTAGRSSTGQIQAFLQRGTPIAKGSDYTISGAPYPTKATLDFDEALIRATEKQGPDIVPFKASGNEKVITNGGGENKVPRGSIAFADAVTGKAYESREMALAMRPEGGNKKPIKADEKGKGKPAASVQKAKRAQADNSPIPAASKGEGLLIIRKKSDPNVVRMMSPKQVTDGKTMQDLIGSKGKIEDWEVKYAPANQHTHNAFKLRNLFDRLDAPDENLTGDIIKKARDTSAEADAPPPAIYNAETMAVRSEPLTAEEVDAINAATAGALSPVKEGDSLTVKDLMMVSHITHLIDWKRLEQIGGVPVVARALATLSDILSRTMPDGIMFEQGTRAQAVDMVETIFQKYAPEEVKLAKDFISRRLGGKKDVAPNFRENTKVNNLNTDYADGIQAINLNGTVRNRPASSVLYHEVAHWAYLNILTDADRAQFWRAMEKYVGNPKAVQDALPEYDGMPVPKEKPLKGGNANLNPQELFAQQFEMWVTRNGDPALQDEAYWKKIGRYVKAIFDRYMGNAKIDADLEPLFSKILPDDQEGLFRGGVDYEPQTDAGKQYAKRLTEVRMVQDTLEEAISSGSHDGIINGYKEMVSMLFSLKGDAKKTGTFMPTRRLSMLMKARIADFDAIMGTDFASYDGSKGFLPPGFEDFGGGTTSSNMLERAEMLADFYYNGYNGKYKPTDAEGNVAIPAQIKDLDATSPSALLDIMGAAITGKYKMAEGTSKLPAGAKPRKVYKSKKVSKGATTAAKKVERSNRAATAEAEKVTKAKSKPTATAKPETATTDYKGMGLMALRKSLMENRDTEAAPHLAMALIQKEQAMKMPKTKVEVPEAIKTSPTNVVRAAYLKALYEGNADVLKQTSYELRLRYGEDVKLSDPVQSQTLAAISQERMDSIGIPDNNGIPASARATVREMLSYMTHRDPVIENSMRTMTYRMVNLMGRTAKATVENANLMSAQDVARLSGRPQSVVGSAVFADFRSPEFTGLRSDLRRMAVGLTKGKSDPLDLMHEIGHVVMRSGAMPDKEMEAIYAAYDAADDKIKKKVIDAYGSRYADFDARDRENLLAGEWFSESLAKYMSERVGRGDIYEQITNGSFEDVELRGRFDRAIDRLVEYVAYVVNGLIGRDDIRQTFRRLSFYGDMMATRPKGPLANSALKGRALSPELAPSYASDVFLNAPRAQKDRARRYVSNGYGADENGNPVAFYHGTPNGDALSRNKNPRVKISSNGNFGPGFYVAADPRPADQVYTQGTPEAMIRAMETANPDATPEQVEDFVDLALNIGDTRKRIATMRREYTMLLDSVGQMDEISREIMDQEIEALLYKMDRMIDTEYEMLEEVNKFGVDFSPAVLPVYVRLKNPVDFRKNARYEQGDPALVGILERLITEDGVEIPSPPEVMDGNEAYKWLVSSLARSQDLSADQARARLNTSLQQAGHDGLLTTHSNVLDLEGTAVAENGRTYAGEVTSYDAPILFSGNNVKSVDAVMYDETSPLLYNRTPRLVPANMNASIVEAIADGRISSMSEVSAASIGEEVERGGDPSLSGALMSMASGRKPTAKEVSAMVNRGPRGWIMSQDEQFAQMGMNWVSGWYRNIFPDVQQRLAKKYMPLEKSLRALPDADGKARAWVRSVTVGVGQKQPDSYTRIVRALRHGEGSRQEMALTAQERSAYQQVRNSFNNERDELVKSGIFMGKRKNYFPQVYNVTAIEKDPEGYKAAMANYYVIEKTKIGEPVDMQKAMDFGDYMHSRIVGDDSDGVFVPLEGGSRNPQADSIDFARMVELEKHPEALREIEKYLENDLEAILVKYFEGSSRRLAHIEKMGVNSHGLYDYLTVIDQGAEGIAHLLSTNKTFTKEWSSLDLKAQPDTFNLKEVTAMPFSKNPGAALKFANEIIAETQANGTAAARKKMMDLAPRTFRGEIPLAYTRRVDAIVGALADYKGQKSGMKNEDLQWVQEAMNVAMRKRMKGTSEVSERASQKIRAFNSITLLSYTMLTSLGDVMLPLIRSGNMQAFIKAQRKYHSDPIYREAIARTGVAIESITHERMIHLFGGSDGKLSTSFFNATGLTPWTDFNRRMAGAVGLEALIAEQQRAFSAHKAGVPYNQQPASFRKAYRFMKRYGVEEFAPGGSRAGQTLSDLSLTETDDTVRKAVIHFANDAVFAPNPNDIPLWAQTPWGAVITQLKTFPLMMHRMTSHIVKEANKGNLTPLIYLATFGPASGAVALGVKDIVQMRGGDEGDEADFRKRNLLKSMGYDEDVHGDENDFLGWYLEGVLMMGGLGILGDMMHSVGTQVENGAYGQVRILSTIGGPSVGLITAATTVGGGVKEMVVDGTESNYKERSAVREVATRIPGIGGNRAAREGIVNSLFPKEDESNGTFGERFTESWTKKF